MASKVAKKQVAAGRRVDVAWDPHVHVGQNGGGAPTSLKDSHRPLPDIDLKNGCMHLY
jgi:hypothetical protein